MTVVLQFLVSGVLAIGGVALIAVAWLSFQGKLPRNRYAGVRTPATLRSDEAFDVGNRVAAPATVAGGLVALISAAAMALAGSGTTGLVLAVGGVVGAFSLVFAAGVLGNRAAEAVPEPEVAGGCGGCPGGCCG
ncbi:hypothetical protein GIY23_22420 [Allosaccharopolyspora coralli]|uniref:SdpI family protein n=1 Tax=Allosaccharopolyspora coralli TaxID=2665642 RepID=A0A5Q3QBF2_9PSEU|nr:SdpI family protein [Allosaccharopolyspora coralli]QGK71888.1 hypothetical protein GIY23_22420 [Allosaccharopolyspora coralli]